MMPAICNICHGKGYRYIRGYCVEGDWDEHPYLIRCYDCGGHGVYRDEAPTVETPAVTMAEMVTSG